MGYDFILALVLAVALTILICVIEVTRGSKTFEFQLWCRAWFAAYLAIAIVGNTATTMVAGAVGRQMLSGRENGQGANVNQNSEAAIDPLLESKLPWFFYSFLYAFVGVFAFKALLEQINVTFANKGVLTIEEWISKARDGAIAAAIEARASAETSRIVTLGKKIDANSQITDAQLNTYVDNWLGPGQAASLEKQAAAAGGNPRLHKALALAAGAYDRALNL